MQLPASGTDSTPTGPSPVNPWVDHLGRVSYIRGHISLYAIGCVLLLALNLLFGDGAVWADTAIGAWGILLIAHGIVAVIARLTGELLAEDDGEVRPATEVRWNAPSTWGRPPRPAAEPPAATPAATPPASTPPTPSEQEAAPETPADTGSERVSWKEATRAAWLAPRSEKPPPKPEPPASQDENDDDPNDFTPLKLD